VTTIQKATYSLFLLLAVSSWGTEKQKIVADHIVIIKSARTMTLMDHDKVLKTYRVALGSSPVGAKQKQGDGKTPEGDYVIDSKNTHSQYYLSLHISYPNAQDRNRARKLGVNPGGDIMIHGLPPAYAYLGSKHTQWDWTWGCIAVTDEEIEEIWNLVPVGTRVEIRP
jgi:murein L,D-transpeptidase YafK